MRQVVLICAVLAALLPTSAGAAERVWRIGVLAPVGDSSVHSVILPYLATRGFVEGRNLVVDLRTGTEDQMSELAQVMVAGKPDAIIAASDWALHPARAATSIIPIVAAPMGADPVLAGVAESWAHPGGNVTGVSLIAPELELKRLSLLREVLPSVHRIAVLSNHRKVVEAGLLPLRKAAAQVGLELVEIWVESPNEYATATSDWRLSRERPEGPADWLRPQPQGTWPTGSRLCRAHPQRRASRRVTVPRPHASRLRHQHADRQSTWPHYPVISPRGRRRADRMKPPCLLLADFVAEVR